MNKNKFPIKVVILIYTWCFHYKKESCNRPDELNEQMKTQSGSGTTDRPGIGNQRKFTVEIKLIFLENKS